MNKKISQQIALLAAVLVDRHVKLPVGNYPDVFWWRKWDFIITVYKLINRKSTHQDALYSC